MQISGKYLLSSAESLLNRRQQNRSTTEGSTRANNRELQPALIHSRIMQIQSHLTHVQYDYSREQARLASVDAPEKDSLQFDGQPLFPEADRTDLKEKIQDRMESLGKQLKSLQVEMENMVALGFKPDGYKLDPHMLEENALRPLDPQRVARLTRSVPSES